MTFYVASDTWLLTTNGHVQISNVENSQVSVWNCNKDFVDANVIQTGTNQHLVKVKTSLGFEIECAEYQPFSIDGNPNIHAANLEYGMIINPYCIPHYAGNIEIITFATNKLITDRIIMEKQFIVSVTDENKYGNVFGFDDANIYGFFNCFLTAKLKKKTHGNILLDLFFFNEWCRSRGQKKNIETHSRVFQLFLLKKL